MAENAASNLNRLLATEETIRDQRDHKLLATLSSRSSPNPVWREKVTQWCYDVADHLRESRSIVFVATNILDRYCADLFLRNRHVDERTYEMSSMTAMFLAVRIAGNSNLSVHDVVATSQGCINEQDLIVTGVDMLKNLSWDHRLVAPLDFIVAFLDLIPVVTSKQAVLDSASYLAELAVCDSSLAAYKASDIAQASLMNVLRAMPSCSDSDAIEDALTKVKGLDRYDATTAFLRDRLHRLYSLSYESRSSDGPHVIEEVEEGDNEARFQCSASVRNVSDDNLDGICPREGSSLLKRVPNDEVSRPSKRPRLQLSAPNISS